MEIEMRALTLTTDHCLHRGALGRFECRLLGQRRANAACSRSHLSASEWWAEPLMSSRPGNSSQTCSSRSWTNSESSNLKG